MTGDLAGGARVGLVLVPHSALAARGAAEMAAQVAGEVRVIPVGGAAGGGLGTDYDSVVAALKAADAGPGVLVLADLGSAIMTAETAIEQLPEADRARVILADAPLIEGAVAAAVAAQTGAGLAAVRTAAEGAGNSPRQAAAEQASARYARTVTLTNADGLHARPAAEFVKLAATFPARVTVNGRDARSLLAILSLGLTTGSTIEIATEEPQGHAAVDALVALVTTGFEKGA
ncbi:dihydroxyacetone kinase phosphoryl donor subunit DhaM [Gryllotalpicola daejeonensis]|uniref:Phosphocarrier protein HPr n=1 Tax=Gryllotalpicola daejeonensis TaxID=993087 RepID=A0ABP7ZDH7_9MICO